MDLMNRIALARIELKHLGIVMVTLIVLMVKTNLDVLVYGIDSFSSSQIQTLFCAGCSGDEFSCNDWNPRYRRSTCIPLEQRCDGTEQCPTGFDEIDCNVLTDTLQERKVCEMASLIFMLQCNSF